jgi:hypothetical protein
LLVLHLDNAISHKGLQQLKAHSSGLQEEDRHSPAAGDSRPADTHLEADSSAGGIAAGLAAGRSIAGQTLFEDLVRQRRITRGKWR